jgi:hypothetical protein
MAFFVPVFLLSVKVLRKKKDINRLFSEVWWQECKWCVGIGESIYSAVVSHETDETWLRG